MSNRNLKNAAIVAQLRALAKRPPGTIDKIALTDVIGDLLDMAKDLPVYTAAEVSSALTAVAAILDEVDGLAKS